MVVKLKLKDLTMIIILSVAVSGWFLASYYFNDVTTLCTHYCPDCIPLVVLIELKKVLFVISTLALILIVITMILVVVLARTLYRGRCNE